MTTIEATDVEAAPPNPPRRRLRRFASELGTFVVVALLVGALGLGFAWPWDRPFDSTSDLDRYAPLVDGQSVLVRQEQADGTVFEASNQRLVPVLRALNEWPDTPATALRTALGDDGSDDADLLAEHDRLTAVETRFRTVAADGAVTESTNYAIRNEEGDHLLVVRDVEGDELVLTPPALLVPVDLAVGRTWSTKGKIEQADYQLAAEVTEAGAHRTELGDFPDCLHIESVFDVTPQGGELIRSTIDEWLCAGAGGVVESREVDDEGKVTSTDVRVAINGFAATDRPDAPAPPAEAAPAALRPPASWKVTSVGRLARTGDANEATFPPVYVDAADPLVLAASYNGDLVAFNPAESGDVRWRFHAGGTVYGAPTVGGDGTIYFGATDKRVYAVDPRGLFLWSFSTGDNVAASPLLVDDTLVVAGEDRRIYGLDPDTGAQRWFRDTSDPIASSPAAVANVVAVGSDSGGVEAVDARTGELLWRYAATASVEAGVAASNETFYVATTDGVLSSVAAEDGTERWAVEVEAELRSRPTVVDDLVVAVDNDPGFVRAFTADSGHEAWTSADDGYVGPVAVTTAGVVAARADGGLRLLDPTTGETVRSWEADVADDPVLADLGSVGLGLGPGVGGGAVWFADEASNVYRLGPPLAAGAPEPLAPAWIKTFTDAPYSDAFSATPAAWGDQLVVIDGSANVLLADPATGDAERLGTIDTESRTLGGPAVTGDLLLAVFGSTLHARRLPSLDPVWTGEVSGTAFAPPVTDGETVVVAVTEETDADVPPARLVAFDVESGTQRWSADLGPVVAATGVALSEGRAHAAGAAFDLDTGARAWSADVGGVPAGGVGSDEHGTYVAALDTASDSGVLTALDHEGNVRWQDAATGEVVPPSAAPQSTGTVVVTVGLEGKVLGRDAMTGETVWTFDPPADRFGGDVTLVDDGGGGGSVWVVLNNGQVVVLDAATGQRTRHFTALDFELDSWSKAQRPAVVGSTVAVPIGLILLGFED